MQFYILLAIAISLVTHILSKFVKSENKRLMKGISGGVILLIISACRSIEVGADTQTYVNAYQYIDTVSWKSIFSGQVLKSFEIGYLVLCKLFSYVSVSEHFFLFWTSALSLIPVIYYIEKYSKSPVISYWIYIFTTQYLFEMGVIRQSISMGIVLLVFDIIYQKKEKWRLKSFFLIMFASLIHKSALMAYILLVVSWIKKIDLKYYIGVCATLICVIIFGDNLVKIIIKMFGGYSVYTQLSTEGIGRLVIAALLWVFFLLYKKEIYKLDANAIWWEQTLVISFILQVFSYFFIAAARGVLIYNFSYAVIIPNLISCANKRDKYVWTLAILGAYILLLLLRAHMEDIFFFHI